MMDRKKAADLAYAEGYRLGADSRDAEVVSLTNQRDYEYVRAENAEQERDQLRTEMNEWRGQAHRSQSDADRLKEENDQLRAQINKLREALGKHVTELMNIAVSHGANSVSMPDDYVATAWLLSETPEQSLAEYRNKVIEAFVNEFPRHVGGDGEFWLHELQDFAMKDLAKRVEFQKAAWAAEHEELTKLTELERERDTAWAQAHRLALELECLIMDTKDNAVVSKWWDSAFEAIEEYQTLKPGADEESESWAKMRKVGI